MLEFGKYSHKGFVITTRLYGFSISKEVRGGMLLELYDSGFIPKHDAKAADFVLNKSIEYVDEKEVYLTKIAFKQKFLTLCKEIKKNPENFELIGVDVEYYKKMYDLAEKQKML